MNYSVRNVRPEAGLVDEARPEESSNSNPVGRLQLHVLMAVTEFEREII